MRSPTGLEHYCRTLVSIKSKEGKIVPFEFNAAQRALDAKIAEQVNRRGLVRAIILKARQLGISTWIAARYFRKTSLWSGQNTYILTHEDKATQNLFNMAKGIHERMPLDFKPTATTANANEMLFGKMDSGYRVGTAKNIAGGGRSLTLQNFHGSEVAFWAHAETHFSGVMQAVPLAMGTEMILESTANGLGGVYYDQWVLAEAHKSDFEAIFLPWYIDPMYRREPSQGYQPGTEEEEYATLYDLDEHQLCWMHFKNIELHGQPGVICPLFRQEYPANAAEAFQTANVDSYIQSPAVLLARRRTLPDQNHMPRVLGVDVARGGNDRTRIIDRQGRKAGGLINKSVNLDDEYVLAEKLAIILKNRTDIRRCFIDVTSFGAGCFDILRNNGFEGRVVGVHFGSGANEPERYANKRSEIWGRMKDWFADPAGVDIPDDDELHRHIVAPGYRYKGFDGEQLLLEKKELIKKRLGFSPDGGDALALTFTETHVPLESEGTEKKDGYGGWNESSDTKRDTWLTR